MEKYPHLPQANPDRWRPLDDHDFDAEVDRDPYASRRPGSEPNFRRGLLIGIGIILMGIGVIMWITAIFLG